MYYGYHFKTRAELIAAMEEYITYYNTERINAKRKGKEVYRASNKIKKNTDERCY